MTVVKRDGSKFFNGYTWHASVVVGADEWPPFVPSIEYEWDGVGKPTQTGRYALLSVDDLMMSQREQLFMQRTIGSGDRRVCTKREHDARKWFLDATLYVNANVPERLLDGVESPF